MARRREWRLPISYTTLFAMFIILNGLWLMINLLGIPIFASGNQGVQKFSVWIAAIASVLGGLHMISIRFRHKAVKSLL